MDGSGSATTTLRAEQPDARSTARSPASAPAAAPRCRATTCSSRRVGGLMSITGAPEGDAAEGRRRARRRHLPGCSRRVGILAALRHRDAHRRGPAGRGRPAHLACSRRSSTRARPTRSPAWSAGGWATRHPSIAPYELFAPPTASSSLAVGNDRQFSRPLRGARRARARGDDALRHQRCPGRRTASALRTELEARLARAAGGRLGRGAARRRACRPGRSTTSPARSPSPSGSDSSPIVEIPRDGRWPGSPHPQPDRTLGHPGQLPDGASTASRHPRTLRASVRPLAAGQGTDGRLRSTRSRFRHPSSRSCWGRSCRCG